MYDETIQDMENVPTPDLIKINNDLKIKIEIINDSLEKHTELIGQVVEALPAMENYPEVIEISSLIDDNLQTLDELTSLQFDIEGELIDRNK